MNTVSISLTNNMAYPNGSELFRPSVKYPEYPFEEVSLNNNVYETVRNALILMEYDIENLGSNNWNPLKGIVSPGSTVLIKPNLVMDINTVGGVDCLYTNPSIVAPVIDYVIIALKGKGRIIIGDAPLQECDFDNLINKSGYKYLVEYYKSKGFDIELVDFRELKTTVSNGVYNQHVGTQPLGTVVKLGKKSEFYGCNKDRYFRITNYDPRILLSHHNGDVQEYYISNKVLQADVIINMPKPKTHRKAGVTISLKNIVGINSRKEYLPHHTLGAIEEGGDEYLEKNNLHSLRSLVWDIRNIAQYNKCYRFARLLNVTDGLLTVLLNLSGCKYAEGSWYGNNTISRTISDLNKIIIFADKNGVICDTPQRKMLIVADMIVSGEKEGPICPSPKELGIVAVGENPIVFDKIISTVMGFDYKKIPTIKQTCKVYSDLFETDNHIIKSNDNRFDKKTLEELSYDDLYHFEPTDGWKGHIEL